MTPEAADGDSRTDRLQRARRGRRVWVVLGSAVALVVVATAAYTGWRYFNARAQLPPEQLVVIGESELEDGTKAAGLVAVIDARGATPVVEAVDTAQAVVIPGTSYDRLRDALAMGDADLVAALAVGEDANVAWLLLDEAAWSDLIDSAGGAEVDLPGGTTVFTGEQLFRFSAGEQRLDGERTAALVRGSELLGDEERGRDVRLTLGAALGRSVVEQGAVVAELVAQREAESSDDTRVRRFLERLE